MPTPLYFAGRQIGKNSHTWPLVGSVMRERILSRVDFPAPLRPVPVPSLHSEPALSLAEGNADDLPALHLEGNVGQRPEIGGGRKIGNKRWKTRA